MWWDDHRKPDPRLFDESCVGNRVEPTTAAYNDAIDRMIAEQASAVPQDTVDQSLDARGEVGLDREAAATSVKDLLDALDERRAVARAHEAVRIIVAKLDETLERRQVPRC